jgi:hypothetical protein
MILQPSKSACEKKVRSMPHFSFPEHERDPDLYGLKNSWVVRGVITMTLVSFPKNNLRNADAPLEPFVAENPHGHCVLLHKPGLYTGFGRRDWTRTNDPHHVKVVL